MHRRRWIRWTLAALAPAAQACYEFVPVETPVAPAGQLVELRISDPGRVGLTPRFGPGLDRVTGRFISQRDSEITLRVTSVTDLEGRSTRWSGEEVQLDRGFVRTFRSRKLSPTKTAIMATAAAAVLYFTAGRSLIGGGKDPKEPPDPVEPPVSTRRPAGVRLRAVP